MMLVHKSFSQCSLDFLKYKCLTMTIQNKSKSGYHKPPKPFSLSFTNIRGLRCNFSHVESFLCNSLPDVLAICETNLNPSISSSDFSVPGYLPLNRKDSSIHMHGLGIFVRDTLPISRELNLESSDESYICLRQSLLQSTSYLFFVYRSPSSQSCSVIDSISENIDKALLAHPSANIFVFGDFNIHHSEWLPFSHTTSSSGINTYNFAISHSLTQLVDSPTRTPDRNDQEPSLLDLFLSSNPDICKTSTSCPLGNSDHSVVNVAIDFNSSLTHDPPIHRQLFSYHRGDWDNFRDLIRDIPLDYIFSLDADNCAKEITSWLQVGIDAFIPSRKYQVKSHSAPWFSPAIAAAISHRNHFYHLYQRCSTEENRNLFVRARNDCKKIIEPSTRKFISYHASINICG